MSLLATPEELQKAANHLSEADAVLAPVIAQHGLARLEPHTDYYQELVDSIISQQLSVHAARAIEQRFRDLFGGHFPAPAEILSTDAEALRGIGFSYAKARYVLDLAQHIVDGKVRFDHLDALSNEEIIAELTAVKGIGEWTVHMFLMFCMGRLDVLPVGDLGIRNGIRKLYGFNDAPTPQQIRDIAEQYSWHPYESAASWYVWQSLDNAPAL
ncbi:MAG TPA: DNA-3-methyladenine glycosylase [Candidatus Saccharimonadales bacterium]|nr:DNA-3-methyladenine glycosylase [Candidatus Saccharimonadales bacterium]